MGESKWADRAFSFNTPVEWANEIVERLQGTHARLRERIAGIPQYGLVKRNGDSWSIQEHIGHLGDLEPLWMVRATQLLHGENELQPADMTNQTTWDANHNDATIDRVLSDFVLGRGEFLCLLETLGPEDFARAAHHPRLNAPMRLIDLCEFIAIHDDYHLCRIRELR